MSSETGVLAVLNNVDPSNEAEYSEWYQREHVAERVGIPGFRSGRRFRALDGDPKYLSVYETDSVDVLTSDAYLTVLNAPTEWTRQVMPVFRDMRRCVCSVNARAGIGGTGGAATACLFNTDSESSEAIHAWICGTVLQQIADSPGIVNAELWQIDIHASQAPSTESGLRITDREVPNWCVFVEGVDTEAIGIIDTLLPAATLEERGAGNVEFLPRCEMLYALRA